MARDESLRRGRRNPSPWFSRPRSLTSRASRGRSEQAFFIISPPLPSSSWQGDALPYIFVPHRADGPCLQNARMQARIIWCAELDRTSLTVRLYAYLHLPSLSPFLLSTATSHLCPGLLLSSLAFRQIMPVICNATTVVSRSVPGMQGNAIVSRHVSGMQGHRDTSLQSAPCITLRI